MVTQQLSQLPYRPVTVYIPNERETQILGGTQTHVVATNETCFPLATYARQQGLDWLVRQESLIRYPRAAYTRPQDRIGALIPDCLVALGVQLAEMEPYNLEQVGVPPILVVEIVSKYTQQKDKRTKIQAFADMGIQEYLIFDPRPRKKLELLGFRLVRVGQYVPIPSAPEGGVWLASVGLRAVGERATEQGRGNRLRLYTRAGEPLLYTHEEVALRIKAEQALEHAEQRIEHAEQRIEHAEQGWEVERQAREQAERAREQAELASRQVEEQRDRERAKSERLMALLAAHGIAPDSA